MRTVPVLTGTEAAQLIADSAVISISSSSGLGCPDAVLEAIGRRYAETGSPANLTTLHPIAAGDMYGIKGVDHLCRPGQLRRVIAGSYPSGGSKLDPPLIRRLIHSDQIQALNIPSGVLFQMHRAASTGQPGVLTEVGLGTYADPRHEGAKMNAVTDDFVQLMQVDGSDYLFYPAVHVDVAIIRATTADPHGNLSYEEECSTLGALDQAYAAHNKGGIVIAQVKRLSETQLPTQAVHIPGILVDAIVVDPDQMQTTQTFYDPALSGEIHRDLDDIEPVEFGLEKVIARRAAAELQVNAIVNLGFGISAAIPRVLLEEGHADDVTWVIEQGAVGGFPGHRVRVRVRTEPGGAAAKHRPVHPVARRWLRCCHVVVPGGIGRRRCKRVLPSGAAARYCRRRRFQRHHHPRTEDRLLRLLHRWQEEHQDRQRPTQDHLRRRHRQVRP